MRTLLVIAIALAGCASQQVQTRPDPTAQQASAVPTPIATAQPITEPAASTTAPGTTADANLLRAREQTSADPAVASGPSVTDDDAQISQAIKKALLDDKGLSFAAKNVEVSTANGKVTLRGVVPNEQERQVVEDNATKFVASDHVDNQVQIRD